MANNLLIVESPAKASTINSYLGSDFKVLASYGHIRDLVPKEGAVDTENGFTMKYQTIDSSKKHVDALVKAAKKASTIYLATDLDREGEAISWHIYEIMREKNLLKDKQVYRVVFNEITKKAIQDAVSNPRDLAMDLVNAQQARRALDYLVGFNLSPLLWRKVSRGLSAGRVQSPALRMIVEREEEIEAFIKKEYWTIESLQSKNSFEFPAKLARYQGERLKQFDINSEELANKALSILQQHSSNGLRVDKVTEKQRKRRPAPPFITSTLQQEASRKLRFSAQKTMRTAQQLYEGISGQAGLITYMRTDSVHLSDEAVTALREAISDQFGQDKLPAAPNVYKTKSKNAQEAHEAIRPTTASQRPQDLRSILNDDQFKLYELIWKRTLACQMTNATIATVAIDLGCGPGNMFRANGSTIIDPGFLSVYEEGVDDSKPAKETGKESRLPPLKEGDIVDLKSITPIQHFTEPPPRFTEASLVKSLEEHGIGRPSTYASIIQTLLNREYVEFDRRRFTPTDMGRAVANFLGTHFTQYVDYDFTANLEDQLDEVSRGEKEWVPLLENFWKPFIALVEDKMETVSRDEAKMNRELGIDPKSGKPMSARLGRFGPFVQIGTRDDEDKPKFASLRAGQKISTITFEEALELFKLPRTLGETPEGEKVSVNIGRFGPYIRYENKFVSLGKEDDPYTVGLEKALELVAAKKEEDANKIIKSFDDGRIQILRGRWGPYVTDGNKNGKIPKDVDAEELTLEQCDEIIAKAPDKKRRGKKKAVAKKKTTTKKKTTKKATKKKASTRKKTTRKKATKKKAVAKKKASS